MAEGVFTLDLNETFPQLSRAPIVEAVIHWQARAQNWPEHEVLDAALAERLPGYPTRTPIQKVEMTAVVSGEDASSAVRLKSADERHVIKVMRDGLAFSRVKEYEHWEPFRDAANEAWRVFVNIAAPLETQRLGVRFINHIAAATPANLKDILRDPPTCPSNLPLREFVYQSTFDVPGHPYSIRVIKVMQLSMPELQQSSGLFLDIDVFSTTAVLNEPAALNEALTQMRWLKNKVFFSLLTDAAIESFKEEGPMNAAPEYSNVIDSAARRPQEALRNSTLGHQEAIDEMWGVWDECRESNWDGYNALPVEQETYRAAYALIESLPLGFPRPSIGAEPDGHITLEWYRSPHRTLSVSVDPNGLLHYAGFFGPKQKVRNFSVLVNRSKRVDSTRRRLVDMLDPTQVPPVTSDELLARFVICGDYLPYCPVPPTGLEPVS